MKWTFAAAGIVLGVNAVVLGTVARERRASSNVVSITACAGDMRGGGDSETPPELRLRLVEGDSTSPAGLDSIGLVRLGFSEAAVVSVGGTMDSLRAWPKARPAWVRLRQLNDSTAPFVVVEVAPLDSPLRPDSASLTVRARVLLSRRMRRPPKPHDSTAVLEDGPPTSDTELTIYPRVVELIPAALHLTSAQGAELSAFFGATVGCKNPAKVAVANQPGGAIWVSGIR